MPIPDHMRHRAFLIAATLAGFGGCLMTTPALAAPQSGPADLSIALTANTHRAHPGSWVYFTVTVTNHGPNTAVGSAVAVATRGGLSDPTLVWAPYDAVQTDCPAGSLSPSSSCATRWVPPRCVKTKTWLTCTYSDYEMAAAPSRADSLTIMVKARTGKPGHERAVASVRGADDPNSANNRA